MTALSIIGHSEPPQHPVVTDSDNDGYSLSPHRTVFEPANGKEVLDIEDKQRPKRVLSDERMPIMDGYVPLSLHFFHSVSRNVVPASSSAKERTRYSYVLFGLSWFGENDGWGLCRTTSCFVDGASGR